MIRGNTMFIKDFISYFDIIIPLFILYLFYLTYKKFYAILIKKNETSTRRKNPHENCHS